MNRFLRFYCWGAQLKFHMALYTVALLFFKSLSQLLLGRTSVEIFTMLEMLVASFLFSILETFLFPSERELSRPQLCRRTLLWAVGANLVFLGGSFFFGWFAGVPLWASIVLIIILQIGLFAMWLAIQLALRRDSRQLNDGLHKFQRNT